MAMSIYNEEWEWILPWDILIVILLFFFLGTGDCVPEALIVFGDSTLDVGVNTYLRTPARSNFPPYGRDFLSHKATGRFCNGEILTDFIGASRFLNSLHKDPFDSDSVPQFAASFVGVPSPLPYTHPEAKGRAILHGIDFASASSGYLDDTSIYLNIASLSQQLKWYKDYKDKLIHLEGAESASKIISNALFLLGTGCNDYTQNYYTSSMQFPADQFRNLLIQKFSETIEELYYSGARKIAVISLPAMGCMPSMITYHGRGSLNCIDYMNQDAEAMNQRLKNTTNDLNIILPGLKLTYLDLYHISLDASQNPAKYGFAEGSRGCCGSGRFESCYLCNSSILSCPDASRNVYWDAYHLTESMNRIVARSMLPALSSLIDSNIGQTKITHTKK